MEYAAIPRKAAIRRITTIFAAVSPLFPVM
jgi:hypothetical protein